MNKLVLKRLLDLHISGHRVPPPVLEFVLSEISQVLGKDAKVTMLRADSPVSSITQRHRQSNEK